MNRIIAQNLNNVASITIEYRRIEIILLTNWHSQYLLRNIQLNNNCIYNEKNNYKIFLIIKKIRINCNILKLFGFSIENK